MFETLHPAGGIQSDNWCHSFAALQDKPEPRGCEPVLERSEGKNLRSPEFVTVFMKTGTKGTRCVQSVSYDSIIELTASGGQTDGT
jgi:hypothetical protein